MVTLVSASSLVQIVTIITGGIAGFLLCRSEAPVSAGHMAVPVSRSVGLAALAMFFALLFGLPVLHEAFGAQGIALFQAFYRSGALVFGGDHVVLPLLREAVVAPGWVGDDTFLAGYGAAQAVPGPLFAVLACLAPPSTIRCVKTPVDFAVVLVCFALLMVWRTPPWVAVAVAAISGIGPGQSGEARGDPPTRRIRLRVGALSAPKRSGGAKIADAIARRLRER